MGVLEDFKALYEDIKVFKTNISKDNQERRKNLELTQKKLIELKQFVTASNSLRTQASLDISNLHLINEIKIYVKQIESLINETNSILKERLELHSNMESFSLKTAGSLLPSMDGNEDTTKKLVDSILFYESLLKNDDKKHLVNYVLKTRLSENAKIRLNKEYDSINELVKDIQDNFISKKSATTLFNQLHQVRQHDKSISQFGNEIDQLLSDLTLAQAGNDQALLKTLRPVNEKIAINSFCNGVKNHEVRTILKARNVGSLKDAITVALDEERNKPSSSNVFYFHKKHGQVNRGFTNNYNRTRGRTFSSSSRNYRGNNYSRNNFRSPFNSSNTSNRNTNFHATSNFVSNRGRSNLRSGRTEGSDRGRWTTRGHAVCAATEEKPPEENRFFREQSEHTQ